MVGGAQKATNGRSARPEQRAGRTRRPAPGERSPGWQTAGVGSGCAARVVRPLTGHSTTPERLPTTHTLHTPALCLTASGRHPPVLPQKPRIRLFGSSGREGSAPCAHTPAPEGHHPGPLARKPQGDATQEQPCSAPRQTGVLGLTCRHRARLHSQEGGKGAPPRGGRGPGRRQRSLSPGAPAPSGNRAPGRGSRPPPGFVCPQQGCPSCRAGLTVPPEGAVAPARLGDGRSPAQGRPGRGALGTRGRMA